MIRMNNVGTFQWTICIKEGGEWIQHCTICNLPMPEVGDLIVVDAAHGLLRVSERRWNVQDGCPLNCCVFTERPKGKTKLIHWKL